MPTKMNSPTVRSTTFARPQTHYRVDLAKEAFTFSAAHFITFNGDICERLHGHNYAVRVSISGPLDANRYVVDFIALKEATLAITGYLDHHVLLPAQHKEIIVSSNLRETTVVFRERRWIFPKEDCLILPVVNTTAEEIAWFILNQIRERTLGLFSDAVTEIEVAVDENQGQWGVCRTAWSLQTTQTD